MSMSSSHIYGYGFEFEYKGAKFTEFLKKHKDSFCISDKEKELYSKFEAYAKDKNWKEIEFLLADYSGEANGIQNVGFVVANIMYRETGIRFVYCLPDGDCDTPEAILFEEAYPWSFTERERLLTEEELQEICLRYMDELGISDEPDYLSQEYYG